MKLPDLPKPDYRSPGDGFHWRRTDNQVRAIQREAYIAGLEEAAKVCVEAAQESYKRWRSAGNVYDDGGCDMANALAHDIGELKGELDE